MSRKYLKRLIDYSRAYDDKIEDLYNVIVSFSYKWDRQKTIHELFLISILLQTIKEGYQNFMMLITRRRWIFDSVWNISEFNVPRLFLKKNIKF